MSQVLQIKRRTTGEGEPVSLQLAELAYNTTGNLLYIGGVGGTVQLLIGPERQVELTGSQIFALGAKKTLSIDDLKLIGGADGYFIKTDGEGNLSFVQTVAAPAISVPVSPPVGGANNVQSALESLQAQIDALSTALAAKG